MTILEIEVGHCYCQRNPLWGRGIAKINRQVHSSVLDFERFDASLILTTNGLELQEHQIQPATVFTHTGYEPVAEELFHKLLAMTKMVKAAAYAQVVVYQDLPQSNAPVQTIEEYMAKKNDNNFSIIGTKEEPTLKHYQAERFDLAKGLKREECQLTAEQIMQEGYKPIQKSTFLAIKDLWTKTRQEVDSLLRSYGIIDDTPMQTYAEAYAKGMKNLLDGVYDVVDVHK